MAATTNYTELKTTEDPLRRKTYELVAWIANGVGVLFNLYPLIKNGSVTSLVSIVFYLFNVFVLLKDYNLWKMVRGYILYVLLAFIGFEILSAGLTYSYKYSSESRTTDQQLGFMLLLITFIFDTSLFVCCFVTIYFLYPDELSLLSQEHPAANALATSQPATSAPAAAKPETTKAPEKAPISVKTFDIDDDDKPSPKPTAAPASAPAPAAKKEVAPPVEAPKKEDKKVVLEVGKA